MGVGSTMSSVISSKCCPLVHVISELSSKMRMPSMHDTAIRVSRGGRQYKDAHCQKATSVSDSDFTMHNLELLH